MNVIAFRPKQGVPMLERIENIARQIGQCDFQEGVPQHLIDLFVPLLAEHEEELRQVLRSEHCTPKYWGAAERLNQSKGRDYHDNFVALNIFCTSIVWLRKRVA